MWKDKDLERFFCLSDDNRRRFLRQLYQDIEWLQTQNMMDYRSAHSPHARASRASPMRGGSISNAIAASAQHSQLGGGGGGCNAPRPGLCLVGAGAGDDPLPWCGDLSRIQPHMPVSSVGRSPARWATEQDPAPSTRLLTRNPP